MRVALAGLAWLALVAGSVAWAQEPGSVERGRAKFEHSCAPCHGDGPGDDGRAMLPGTDALRIKYRGALPALLERRTDLNVEGIRTFVRRGTWSRRALTRSRPRTRATSTNGRSGRT